MEKVISRKYILSPEELKKIKGKDIKNPNVKIPTRILTKAASAVPKNKQGVTSLPYKAYVALKLKKQKRQGLARQKLGLPVTNQPDK